MDNFNNEFWAALDELVRSSEIVIDRPRGTAHPKYPGLIYPVDYGDLKNTYSIDGEGIDVYAGTGKKALDALICTIDLLKRDSEIKLLLGCTEAEKEILLEVHNQTRYMKGILIRR